MPLARTVLPETLDALPEDAPDAVRSRRDLRRVNRVMRARGVLLRTIDEALAGRPAPRRIVELGAGDGSLMLALARRLAPRWPGVRVSLLDRQRVVSPETLAAFGRLGWRAEPLQVDALRWAAEHGGEREDLALANLFVHHFDAAELRALLAGIAARCDAFVACEPRRGALPLAASRLIGLLGVNAVTRHDAVLSVRAGFRDRELSRAWPEAAGWRLRERAALPFSHCFAATREDAGTTRNAP
jgi:hypothetical protein